MKNKIIFLSLFLLSCATTGPGGKKSLIFISTEEEVEIGREMHYDVERKEEILEDLVIQNYVREVGKKIAGVSDRKDIKFYFKVIESKEVNAFALPGGYIYIYTGLMKQMNSESELAAALGHEIGHVVARHAVKKLQTLYGLDLLLEIAGGGKMSKAAQVVIGIGATLVLQGYGRDNEFEADYNGLFYSSKAGFNPNGAKKLFLTLKALEKREPGGLEKLLSSHPPTSERIAHADSAIVKMPKNIKELPLGEESYKSILERLK